jgi:sec-independent protein translocase protein TatB
MFDLGWTELLVIGVVALIVIGPKDLPVMFQQVGRFVGRAKGMAREFSNAMNQAANEAGVKDATSSFRDATDGLNKIANPAKSALDTFKETAKTATKLDLDPESETGKLAEERAEAARKIHEATAKKEQARRDAEAAAKAAEDTAKAPDAPEGDAEPKDNA